ncbi:DUF5689 domain-containing protein [Dysgonomonas sp. 511]|uniref:DUF5689 domain-containing protein n=1 Tax=Dysgonomonas sp. 511 TaxID=2302930 RepID=UPI0013D8A128|nr:DUF5689 domain-containing protein [Dysgonomonas sp. 511]NDV79418.1 hypothetical protein [Dysgonomonas sp. 511]
MKYNLTKYIWLITCLACVLLSESSCKDDVELPVQKIELSSEAIMAPAFAATFTIDIQANCDWTIEVEGNDRKWARISQTKAVGMATVDIALESNDAEESRTLTLSVIANRNRSVVKQLKLVQNAAVMEGYVSVPDIRALVESNETYTFYENKKVRAIVMSSVLEENYYKHCVALQSSNKPNSGITLRMDEPLYIATGTEIEIDLKGAEVFKNTETHLLELKPVSPNSIIQTETSLITPQPVPISIEELNTGKYESMYISIASQVVITDLKKERLSENVTMQTDNNGRFVMYVLKSSSFANEMVPTGGGVLSGIASAYQEGFAVMPCTKEDINLSMSRFDGGIVLPYVFSLMTTGANDNGKYVLFTKESDVRNNSLTATDGTGTTLTANLNASSKAFNYWNDNSGHHNLPMGTWLDGDANHLLFSFPLGQDIIDGFQFSIGMGAQANAPANWQLKYSVDKKNWYTAPYAPHITIPQGKNSGGGKHFFYYSIKVDRTEIPLLHKQTLYIRISPYDKNTVSGNPISNNNGRIQAHSCAVLEAIPTFSTPRPSGNVVYFEPFDKCVEGLDYRYGDKLAAMLNYCGSDITKWEEAVKNKLSGTYVRQRPGYAQIGYVETQLIAQNAYTNNVGTLSTPVLNTTGKLQVSFKAMAYKNTSVYSAGANTAKDFDGDARSIKVEVVGGGTIDGVTSKIITGLDYTSFKTFTFTIENAVPETLLRFTSAPDPGTFSRWFIDDICVTK